MKFSKAQVVVIKAELQEKDYYETDILATVQKDFDGKTGTKVIVKVHPGRLHATNTKKGKAIEQKRMKSQQDWQAHLNISLQETKKRLQLDPFELDDDGNICLPPQIIERHVTSSISKLILQVVKTEIGQ